MSSHFDSCCSYEARKKIEWWLVRLAISLAAVLILATTVVVVLRFVVIPDVQANIEDARLNSFKFDTSQGVGTKASFVFNLSIALTVRNINRAMGVRYTQPLVAALTFYDRRLYNATVADEGHRHQPRKREFHLLRIGGEVPSYVLDTAGVVEFNKQNATGVFMVEVRLSGELTLGIGNKRQLALSCPLTLQLAPPGPEVVVFHQVDCERDKPVKIFFD